MQTSVTCHFDIFHLTLWQNTHFYYILLCYLAFCLMTKHTLLLHFTFLSCILPYDKTHTSITFYFLILHFALWQNTHFYYILLSYLAFCLMTKHTLLLHFTFLSCILPYDKTHTSITFYFLILHFALWQNTNFYNTLSFSLLYDKMQSVLDFHFVAILTTSSYRLD